MAMGKKPPLHFDPSISRHLTIIKAEQSVNVKWREILEEVKEQTLKRRVYLIRLGGADSGHGRYLRRFQLRAVAVCHQLSVDRLDVVLEFTFRLKLNVAAGTARLQRPGLALTLHGTQVLILAQAWSTRAGRDADARAPALTEIHAAGTQTIWQAVDVKFHQILLGTEFLEAGRALVQFGDMLATPCGLDRRPVARLLHVERPVDFEF